MYKICLNITFIETFYFSQFFYFLSIFIIICNNNDYLIHHVIAIILDIFNDI